MSAHNEKWKLIARCLNNTASKEEQDALQELLSADPSFLSEYELLQQFWNDHPLNNDEKVDEELQDNVNRILFLANTSDEPVMDEKPYSGQEEGQKHSFVSKKLKTVLYISFTAVAACIIFLFVHISLSRQSQTPDNLPQLQTIVAQNGAKTRAILPDGSVVWLNSGSKISYRGDFKGPLREVSLEGEAYFDVTKNPSKPFIVHASNINVKVLGTTFNVKSYTSDSITETTLLTGLVQISNVHNSQKVLYLHPNEKITVPKKAEDVVADSITAINTNIKIQNRNETAWVYNRLVFRGDSFKKLAYKLERWYNVKIKFADEKVTQLHFNGSLENETVEEAFKALQAAVPFNYKINDRQVFISSER
jgi:transmembrane sensor